MSFQEQSNLQSSRRATRGTSPLAPISSFPNSTAPMVQFGFVAFLLIAYLHPSMLWTPELPGEFAPLAVPISLLMTGMWFAFGWRILRLSRLAPVGASLTYAIGRGSHLLYRWYSAGEAEDAAIMLVSVVLMAGLLVSGRAAFRARRAHRHKPQATHPDLPPGSR